MINSVKIKKNNYYETIYKTHRKLVFPDGQVHSVLRDELLVALAGIQEVIINFRFKTSEDIIELLMFTDALRSIYTGPISLFCPYWMGARSDRRNTHESLGCKVYADLINAQSYRKVAVLDAHSMITPAVLNNCYNISPVNIIADVIKTFQPDAIVAPDAGAAKRIDFSTFGLPVIICEKVRNTDTGELSSFVVHTNEQYNKCLICDDLIDGGGTYLGLEPFIRKQTGCSQLGLYCTHGIFSKGTKIITEVFDCVFTTNSYCNYGTEVDTIFDIDRIIFDNLNKDLQFDTSGF